MKIRRHLGRFGLLISAIFLGAACGEAGGPVALEPAAPSFAASGPALVECPTERASAASGVIRATGGSLALERHQLSLPPQAVAAPRRFRIAAPASNYMELELNADGHDDFTFSRTGTITIDYSRCTRSNIDKRPLSVWQIDPVTKELIEHMGGVDDKEARTVTFRTDHLSTFSIAY